MAIAKKKSSQTKVVARKRATQKKTVTVKRSAKKTSGKKTSGGAPAKKTAVKKAAGRPAAARRLASIVSPLVKLVEGALADMKAVNVTVLDVRGLTDVADTMIIASGTSDRHVKSIADRVVYDAKQAGFRAMGVEGERDGEWALVDLNDVIVHVMLPRVREFYRLESLWDISAARREAAQ